MDYQSQRTQHCFCICEAFMLVLGTLCGLGTAVSWAISCTVHAAVSKLLGVSTFMAARQLLAVSVLTILCLCTGQFALYAPMALLMALISGILGIAVADSCLYKAVGQIGIRPALVCQSLYSCFTALLGVLLLDEFLGVQGFMGIAIATGGVILVIVAEDRQTQNTNLPASPLKGVALAIFSAICMAIGIITSKAAMGMGVSPIFLTFLRNLMAAMALWGLASLSHQLFSSLRTTLHCPTAIKLLLVGCVFGPVGGTWLSLVALDNVPAAVASTLMGLQPVALLVVSGVWEKRCPTLGSILGSIIACTGAAVLLLR